MKYPSAHAGVKKLFIAEILSVVFAAISLIAAILASIALNNGGEGPLANTAAIIALVAGIVSIVAFVIQLIGLRQANHDHGAFGIAFWITIAALVLQIVASILSSVLTDGKAITGGIFSTIVSILTALAFIYTLFGIIGLSAALGNEGMVIWGRRLITLFVALHIVIIFTEVFNTIPWSNEGARVIFSTITIVAAAIEVVSYVLTLIYYAKAIKMLEK